MGKFIDLTGKKFNRLIVIKRSKSRLKQTIWLCKCECGNIVEVSAGNLKNNHTKSCGCYKNEVTSKRMINYNTTHNLTYTRLYNIWHGMKSRCFREKHKYYKNYGGRGITICNEWKNNFLIFYNWAINNGYTDNLSIDRINVDGNYEPNNCRWATAKEQANNRRLPCMREK